MENLSITKKIGTSRLEKVITSKTKAFLEDLQKTEKLWFFKVSDKFTSGIPDFVGVWRGRFFAIELKRQGGKPRLLQALILSRINKAGGLTLATDDFEDVKKLFDPIALL